MCERFGGGEFVGECPEAMMRGRAWWKRGGRLEDER